VNSAGLDTASKTVGLRRGCGSTPPPSAKQCPDSPIGMRRLSQKENRVGSNPTRGTNNGSLAQLVEQHLDTVKVIGSSPVRSTKFFRRNAMNSAEYWQWLRDNVQ